MGPGLENLQGPSGTAGGWRTSRALLLLQGAGEPPGPFCCCRGLENLRARVVQQRGVGEPSGPSWCRYWGPQPGPLCESTRTWSRPQEVGGAGLGLRTRAGLCSQSRAGLQSHFRAGLQSQSRAGLQSQSRAGLRSQSRMGQNSSKIS